MSIAINNKPKNKLTMAFSPVFACLKIFLVTIKLKINIKSRAKIVKGFIKLRGILLKLTMSNRDARDFLSAKPVKIVASKNNIVMIDLNRPAVFDKNLVKVFIWPPFI